MSNVIQEYGAEHNLAFTTSKTKCIIFSGNKRVQEPPPIMLNGKALPVVRKVDHLGHVLHQSMSMENDSIRAKNSYKRRAIDILAHNVRMETHINVVEGFLCSDIVSLMTQVLSRFPKRGGDKKVQDQSNNEKPYWVILEKPN